MVMVWDLARPQRAEFLFWTWMMVGVPTLTFTVIGLRSRRREDRSLQLAERIAIFGGYATMLLAIGTGLAGIGSGTEESILIGFTSLAGAIVAACSAIGRRTPSADRFTPTPPAAPIDRALGSAGIVAGAAWTVLGTIAILDRANNWAPGFGRQTSQVMPAAVICLAVALPCAIWCGLGLSRVTGLARYLRHASAGTAIALGVVVSYATAATVWAGVESMDDAVGRLIGALVVMGLASLVAGLVMMRLSMGKRLASEPIESIDWTCPRCATRATIGTGEHRCTGCGLAVRIEFRDDRCPACAYDLRGQPADAPACPECGRARQMPGQPRTANSV